MSKVVILSGSNNNNLKLANKFKESLDSKGVSSEVVDLTEVSLPVYTPQEQEQNGIPSNLNKYMDLLSEAKGLVVVAPEYNGSIPPVLSNFIAWISVSGDKGWRACFSNKPAVIGTHSGSGGIHLLSVLRLQLSYLGVNVLGRQIHTHYKKELNEDSLEAVTNSLIKLMS